VNVMNWSDARNSRLEGNCPSRLALSNFRLVGFSVRCPWSGISEELQESRDGGGAEFFEYGREECQNTGEECEGG
jgi:hypothetical protein